MEEKKFQVKNLLENYIAIIDNSEMNKSCDTLINVSKYCEKKFDDARIIGEGKERVAKNIRDAAVWQLGLDQEDMIEVHWSHYLNKIITNAARIYASHIPDPIDVKTVEINIMRYQENGHYIPHTDHHRTQPRTLSFSIFLNDDYDGGDLEFHLPDQSNIYTVKKKKGRIVMFPSNFLYPHKVVPVTKGTRYVVVGWLL
jgi:predicted 2-oxoglutarate/Fe(II)-dependent dioxygenase YbiX